MLAESADTVGSQASLLGRLLTGDIQYGVAATAYVTRDLQEQCRFSDAGIAAYKYHHPRQRTATEHAVEFFNASRQALSFIGANLGNRHGLCGELITTSSVAMGSHRRAFFDEALLLLTCGAPPQPLAALVATVLANVYRAKLLSHHFSPGRRKTPLRPPCFSMRRTSVMHISRSTALHMSYTVSAAAATAVNASISTPVFPVTRATLSIWIRPASGSKPNVRSTLVNGSG